MKLATLVRHSFSRRVAIRAGIVVLLAGVAAVLYPVDPEQAVFLPKCSFYLLTGWECPACGTQRAIHHLLHGHVREAFAYNPFLLVSLPYLAALVWTEWFVSDGKQTRLGAFCRHRRVVDMYLALIVFWWIGRNVYPFQSA